MRRWFLMLAALAAAAALAAGFASSAGAYGGGASHDMWQIGFSFNCNNPDPAVCEEGTGGSWGWVEFDRSADGTQTWGDAELAFCFHTVGGGGAGAGHGSIEVESWFIAPGSAGPQTFYASGEETDFYRGTKTTEDFTDLDTGFSAVPGHYSTDEILGFKAPPGVAIQIQVAFRPRSSCFSARSPWVALGSPGRAPVHSETSSKGWVPGLATRRTITVPVAFRL